MLVNIINGCKNLCLRRKSRGESWYHVFWEAGEGVLLGLRVKEGGKERALAQGAHKFDILRGEGCVNSCITSLLHNVVVTH